MTDEAIEPISPHPYYPYDGTYADLLCWHMDYWGTRPTGNTEANGEPWKPKDFRYKAFGNEGVDQRFISGMSNWRGKGSAPDPDTATKIEQALFGKEGYNSDFDVWREDLRRFHKNSQGRGKNGRTCHFPAPPTPPNPTVKNVPAPTLHFTGRADDVEEIIKALLSPHPRPVLVQGGPGIGKSTLTQKVAYDPRVVARFGQNKRWFVELETASSAEDMRQAIALALGLPPATDFNIVLGTLGAAPGVLILDNLETPWEPAVAGGRKDTEDTLAKLADIPHLAVLASFRGIDTVGGLPWLFHRLEPLTSPFDGDLFCRIAAREDRDDPYFERLLAALGGIPLAIELTALQASGGVPLQEVWQEWQALGTKLASHPDFEAGRLTSLPVSIELSLKSPRLSKEGFALFRLLGQLPAGLAATDRNDIIGLDGFAAAGSLTRTGLAFRRGDRIDLLPPIRDHAARHHVPGVSVGALWAKHFSDLAEALVDAAFSADGGAIRPRIISETPNIEAAIRHALDRPALLHLAIAAARHYRRLLTHTGIGTAALLKAVADACNRAGDSINEGKICVQIGILAQERGDLDDAWQTLERGLAANHRASNATDVTNGKGDCLYRMADIHLYRSKLTDAKALYLQARSFYEISDNARGLGDCIYRLGDIEWRRANFSAARAYVDEAEPEFARANFDLGEANCAWLRARIALDAGDYDDSEALHDIALQRFTKIGVPLGLAHCRNGAGAIALGRGDLPLARKSFEEACQMYVDIKDARGIANCHLGLAKVCHAQGDRVAARDWAIKALETYARNDVFDCMGHCYEELAQLCDDEDERGALAARARDAFVRAELTRGAESITATFGLR